jgi:phage portal protein BeeE
MDWNFFPLSLFNRSGISRSAINSRTYQYLIKDPAWISLSDGPKLRQAVADNPVLYGCIDIYATACSNGKKYLVDNKGMVVPWDEKDRAVMAARKLFVDRPNPLQMSKEFNYERAYMRHTFGNNYVYLNNPFTTIETDLLSVVTMFSLPSDYVEVKQTGKLYDQVELKGIISEYWLSNRQESFSPDRIIHFNDINLTNIGNSIIGSSRLVPLKNAITNVQKAFDAMNVLLDSRGMIGIIKANNKDAQGTQIPLGPKEKDEIDRTFKTEYGLKRDQKQYLISYSDIDFIKTVMNPEELGIPKDFIRNAMLICNNLKVPHELYKLYEQGATFENQAQALKRLYQDSVIPDVENDDMYFTERLNFRKYGLELKTDFSHIPALQEAFKEKAQALNWNANTADKLYNSNLITRNQYLGMVDIDPVDGGDKLKSEWDAEQNKDKSQVLASIIGVGGTQSLTEIVTNATLSNEQKVQLLMRLFAFTEADARAIMTDAKEPEPKPEA